LFQKFKGFPYFLAGFKIFKGSLAGPQGHMSFIPGPIKPARELALLGQ